MAMREIEDEPDRGPKNYVKFGAVGDKVAGFFVKSEVVNGTYGEQTEITVRDRDGKDSTFNATYDLLTKIAKAAPKPGNPLIVEFKTTKPMGQGKNPMKIFSVKVDNDVTKLPPPAAPPPEPGSDDDLPF